MLILRVGIMARPAAMALVIGAPRARIILPARRVMVARRVMALPARTVAVTLAQGTAS